MADDQSKTEDATATKKKKSRDEGIFARTRDAGPVASSLAGLGVLYLIGATVREQFREYAVHCFQEPFDIFRGAEREIALRTGTLLATVIVPIAVASALAAGSVGIYQAGWSPNFDLFLPKFERLMSPIQHLSGMLKPKEFLTKMTTGVARVFFIAYATYGTITEALPVLLRTSRLTLAESSSITLAVLVKIFLRATFAMGILAAGEFFYSKWRVANDMKMSKQEVKDEHKQAEGDVRVKGQIRARGRERIRRALQKSIMGADVVLANPTHISVVLRYRPAEGAPVVLAKGYDEFALYIRELAKKHNIPVVVNKPLARAIAAKVKIGRIIPVEFYTAVAEVLAFVYRLKQRTPWQTSSPTPGSSARR